MTTARNALIAVIAMASQAALAATGTAAKPDQAPAAAAILASASGAVTIERHGAAKAPAAIGMRLQAGDVVVTEPSATATIYYPGGSIRKLAGSSRLQIGAAPAAPGATAPTEARLSTDTMAVLEKGLWILNDPEGSILISAMRGEETGWGAEDAETAMPLSPRFETIAEARPTFRWEGGAPARVAVGSGAAGLWKSDASAAPLAYPETAPALDPASRYWWRLENASTGEPMSEKVSFRVPTADQLAQISRFESETAAMVRGDTVAADLLRSGFYLRTGSWSRMLASAGRLRSAEGKADIAARAFDGACRQMRLPQDAAEKLVGQLTSH